MALLINFVSFSFLAKISEAVKTVMIKITVMCRVELNRVA
jgi:hypothetical protein